MYDTGSKAPGDETELRGDGVSKLIKKTQKLKPCPFCGCADITIHRPSSHGLTLYGIACDGCGVRMKRFDEDEAIAAWNRRGDDI
ncbi:hypothetical protein DNV23_24210 [Salmonella enterica subsp. enterica serovar Hadar]|nr:hypothetical protein [Salmonella enterica subsp. enterica serovar Hadar]